MKKLSFIVAAAIVIFANGAFAQSASIAIPGVGNASGSKGSTIKNSSITVANNSAKNVIVGGGSASFRVGDVTMNGIANVNTVNVTGSTVENSKITVSGNSADSITAIGGTANVNSVNIN